MDLPQRPVRSLTLFPLVMIVLFLCIPVTGYQETTSGGPVSVPSCQEEGQPCSGGSDCIGGICVNSCSGPFCQCECFGTRPDGGGTGWIVVIGVLVILGAGAGVLVLKKKPSGPAPDSKPVQEKEIAQIKKPKPEKEKEKEKEEVQYILQISSNKVKISPASSASVKIMVWKRVGNAAPVPAPNSIIQISAPPDSTDLAISPVQGKGSLEPVFSVVKPPGGGEGKGPRTIKVGVIASAEGTRTESAIEVELTGVFSIEFY